MKFDKSKVYTSVNADELKVGDKVYVADNLFDLEYDVNHEENLAVIQKIQSRDTNARFNIKFCKTGSYNNYYLAYLVERAPEKKWRPFKDIQELIDAWGNKRSPLVHPELEEHEIWIREKTSPFISVCINGYDKIGNQILFGTLGWCDLDRLFNVYEFLDGTPCGVEEV